MKKNKLKRDKLVAYLGVFASISSLVAILVFTLEKSFNAWKNNIDFNEAVPIMTIVLTAIVGIFSYYTSIKLKQRERLVFMIYANKDKNQIEQLKNELYKAGIRVITDQDVVQVGDNIKDTIESNIKRVSKVIIVLSKNTENSNWIEKEIGIAKSKDKLLFPVAIDEVNMPESIKELKYADIQQMNRDTIYPLIKALRN